MSNGADNVETMKKDIKQTFERAVEGLNKGNIRSIAGLFDDDVVMHRIRDRKRTDTGKEEVIKSLTEKCDKGGVEMTPDYSRAMIDCEKGTITGPSGWTDRERGGSPEQIIYTFTLTQAADRKWRIKVMDATLAR
jgi:hypothetical protein